MARRGRKTKRTPEVMERVRLALEGGNTRRATCFHAGISEDTFADWMRKYPDFSDLVTEAEASCEFAMVDIVRRAAQEREVVVTKRVEYPDGGVLVETKTHTEIDAKIALEWLARRRRDEWSLTTKHEVTGPDGGAIQMQFLENVDRVYGKEGSGGG